MHGTRGSTAGLLGASHSRSSSSSSLHLVPSRSIYQNPVESFVVLTESQMLPPPPPPGSGRPNGAAGREHDGGAPDDDDQSAQSQLLRRSERLFEVLSARTNIDHPICLECSELLVEAYTRRLANATRERDSFVEFLKRVNAQVPAAAEQDAREADLHGLEDEDSVALDELHELEQTRADMDAEIERLESEARRLGEEEAGFWRDRNSFTLKLEDFQNMRDGVNLQYDHDIRQLEKLQRTNVYNDTFNIGHDGFFGTINTLRLGRLPNQPVSWQSTIPRPPSGRPLIVVSGGLDGNKCRVGPDIASARHHCRKAGVRLRRIPPEADGIRVPDREARSARVGFGRGTKGHQSGALLVRRPSHRPHVYAPQIRHGHGCLSGMPAPAGRVCRAA